MHGTIGDALNTAQSRLAACSSPQVEAEELMSRLLGVGRTELYLRRTEALAPEHWERLESWLRRRARGEPVQYITGRAAFRGLDLRVTHDVLVPRPETEGLVEAVLAELRVELSRWPAPRVLDLGTGSGAIALALAAEWAQARVTATDASEAAIEVASDNARALGLAESVRFLRGDWFDAIEADERFEVIVANPPYIATGEWDALPVEVREFEPQDALFSGSTGLEALREIVDLAPQHLVTDGVLALELAEMRAQEVASWLDGAHDWNDVRLLDDLAGRPRVLLARRQSGPAIAPLQWPEERA